MSVAYAAPYSPEQCNPEGRDVLDAVYAHNQITSNNVFLFGRYTVGSTQLVETPQDVLDAGEVLTNPSQIFRVPYGEGSDLGAKVAYFRQEPTSHHLEHSKAVAYEIVRDRVGNGQVSLRRFEGAQIIEGEDPRVIPDFPMRQPGGKVVRGCLVSTVVAEAMPDDPAEVKSIRQDFHWGTDLRSLEKVHEIPGLKNTIPTPLNQAGNDIRLHVFGRPKPHISYFLANRLEEITADRIQDARLLSEQFLPPGLPVHLGVNTVNRVRHNGAALLLNAHLAAAIKLPDGRQSLHYDLIDFGFTGGRLVWLGQTATRSLFPAADPKPSENGVADYGDILYGSPGPMPSAIGQSAEMVTGMSDRHVGFATLFRTL